MPITPSQIVSVLMHEHARLVAYINIIVRDEHVAEDVLQSVAMAAIEKAGTINDSTHLHHWLRRAARLEALRVLRDSHKHALLFDAAVLDQLENEFERQAAEPVLAHKTALLECLALVEGYSRQVLDLRYRDGLTSRQIASRLNKRSDAIYRVLTRVRTTLRDCVEGRLSRVQEHPDA